MARNPSPAPSPPLGLPYPWRRGVDVAFAPSPGYRTELPGPTRSRLADAGPAAKPLVRGPLPPVAEAPPVGGFDPRLITGPIGAAVDLAKDVAAAVGDLIRDAWEYLNRRNGTPGTDAKYSQGAPTGTYNPVGANKWSLRVTGTSYQVGSNGRNSPLIPIVREDLVLHDINNLTAGWTAYVVEFPPFVTEPWGGVNVTHTQTQELQVRLKSPSGETVFRTTFPSGRWAPGVQWYFQVSPIDPQGALPFFPDVPAVPFQPDPAGGNPYIDPADIPALDPADAPRVSPFPVPLPARPITPATAPPDARPLIEDAPTIGDAARQVPTATGLLPRLAPRLVPRIAPIPALPVPGYLPQLTPQGEPQLAPAPAPQPTATDQRQYGPRTVTGTGVRPDLEGIAEEVGRIEMKLALLLGTVDLLEPPAEPLYIYGPGVYTLEPVCDFDSQGLPMPAREASWQGGIGEVAELGAKVDALAELLQHHKELRQPICSKLPRRIDPVTVAFEEEPN